MAPMVEDKRTITADRILMGITVGTSLGFVLILPCLLEYPVNVKERDVIQEGTKKTSMYYTGRKKVLHNILVGLAANSIFAPS